MRALPNAIILLLVGTGFTAAQEIRLVNPVTQRWQVGMIVEAPGACTGIVATVPVPRPWPEQQVKIVEEDISRQARLLPYRTLSGGVTQMRISIPRLAAGETAKALITLEIKKSSIVGPAKTDGLTIPKQPSSELRRYLGSSPSIETSDRRIKRLAEEVVQAKADAWGKAEAIYDWVQANIEYKFDAELKGALTALEAGHGDCEELTSLFVALCRANGIPARSVWVPGHCYAEFYLEDESGQGHWYPCQAAGTPSFGEMHETRPILQKGDKFKVQDERKAKRYVAETFTAKNALANPRVQFVRRQIKE